MEKINQIRPTEAELEVLQILWEYGPSTVRDVNDRLNALRDVGYTTTLKIMQIMSEKGLVSRDTSSKTHIYQASGKRDLTQGHLLEDFLRSTFRGSAKRLVLQALGNHPTTPEELEEIKSLIAQLEKDRS